VSAAPPELTALRERGAVLADLGRIHALLFWDQNVVMPPAGASARADHAATLEAVSHERLTDPELGRLLETLRPWAEEQDPDSDDARLIAELRRDHEKAVRVPTSLAAEITRAAALGQGAWQEARAASDFSRFRDALALQLDLRHRYVACFDAVEHPYDVLLDDFEPGMTTARLRPLLAELVDELVPIVAAAAADPPAEGAPLGGPYSEVEQRRAVLDILDGIGFDPAGWRLDVAPHPFAQRIGPGDVRITTRYNDDFAGAYFGTLHEFGHGLYEAGISDDLRRSPLGTPVSLGVHESQSRLWENLVGRGRPFCAWALPRLAAQLPGRLADTSVDELYRSVNAVHRSLIRVEADETTYNLHVALRFELELALMEGTLAVDDLPRAWNEGMERLLGVEVPDDAHGVLQDVHWGVGLIGYFPTYSLGNLMAAQLWEALRADLPDIDDQLERGDFAPLKEWLRERVHRHGRKLTPHELLARATGQELAVEPFVSYLRAKLTDARVL
jgi:carboxypeptidase Taq